MVTRPAQPRPNFATDGARRGRPARLSRDLILDRAVILLEAEAGAPPSLNAIARELGVTPMAIYTYFAGKDELWQALTERLLSDLDLDIPGSAPAVEKIEAWAKAMRRHFLKHPQLIQMLAWEGGHSSVAWLRQGVAVSDALAELGLAGRDLAQATLWIWQVVMGAIHIELRDRSVPQGVHGADFAKLDDALKARLGPLRDLARAHDHWPVFFDYQVERALDALCVLSTRPTKSAG